jgi:hypothetical protein
MLSPIVIRCDELENRGHWLVGNTLWFIIFTCHELCNEFAHQTILKEFLNLDAIFFNAKLEEL